MTTADRIEGFVEWTKLFFECLAMIALVVWLSGVDLL
jgi:hypothetical protein